MKCATLEKRENYEKSEVKSEQHEIIHAETTEHKKNPAADVEAVFNSSTSLSLLWWLPEVWYLGEERKIW